MSAEEKKKKGGLFQAVKECLWRAAATQHGLSGKRGLYGAPSILIDGDMLGVRSCSYYSLRLLPYVVPQTTSGGC
jgi:hypothetical protein